MLSTDNDGIFETTPTQECVVAVQNSDLQYAELKQMYFNSIVYSFADEDTKYSLIKDLEDRFEVFETDWKRE